MNTNVIAKLPLPMCIIDSHGKISAASHRIGDVFLYDGILGADVFALTGIKHDQLLEAADSNEEMLIHRSEKSFRVISSKTEENDDQLTVYFVDVTESEQLRQRYVDNQACYAEVSIDNYDELMSSTEEEHEAELASDIDRLIRNWASAMEASLTKLNDHEFFIVMSCAQYEQQARSKFEILDKAKKIETDADFPVTLSIGIGMGGATPEKNDDYAQDALEIAYGRGGDQVVVKDGNTLMYFGGKTATVEKSNKGKSRIIGHALVQLIETSSRIFIMGHRNPDMDAFGAAIGIYRLAKPINKETYIVLNEYSDALEVPFEMAKESGEYEIISSKKADSLLKERSLVIVVDTHRPSITEYPDLLKKVERTVVIDHHRKAEETIEKPTLAYTEPYASSTAELVTEILQYTIDKKTITKFEAEVLMGGMWVDTNRFSVKTGVRTFEAAAWLRRAGADIADVKKFFQTDMDVFKKRANAVAAARYDDHGMAFSVCQGQDPNAQIINSMVADELLVVKGIRASFVAGRDCHGKTCISARSVRNLNVQVIMEKLGGGGHMNTAGTQMEESPEEAIEKIKEILESMNDESNTEEER